MQCKFVDIAYFFGYHRIRKDVIHMEITVGMKGEAWTDVERGDTAKEVGQVTDRVIAQLAELQDAVSGSKQALREAAATMYTIKPTLE